MHLHGYVFRVLILSELSIFNLKASSFNHVLFKKRNANVVGIDCKLIYITEKKKCCVIDNKEQDSL